jgi:SAM-dependent methyltransferase
VKPIVLTEFAIDTNFNEEAYLRANADVRAAVDGGSFPSGRAHFEQFGRREKRRLIHAPELTAIRAAKMERLRPFLRLDTRHTWRDGKVDFLTDKLREATRIVDTANISENSYDPFILNLIEKYAAGLVLDCGAGRREIYYPNVVNFEIVDYPSTDVLGVGERLPFKDDAFDAVISVAVLEHVADPLVCAAEIARVLKPGGELFCAVPFLQPLHGYPHHYFNATPQGIRRLFDTALEVEDVTVYPSTHPVIALHWILGSYAQGLTDQVRDDFLSMRVSDFLEPAMSLVTRPFATQLPMEKQLELACATVLTARKPAEATRATANTSDDLRGFVSAASLPSQMDNDSASASWLRPRIVELERNEAMLQRALDDVRASNSWRLTAPLRALATCLRALRAQ